jgi:hypothetical protein
LAFKVTNQVPTTPDAVAIQNFWRGKIAAYRDLFAIAEELKEWKRGFKKERA